MPTRTIGDGSIKSYSKLTGERAESSGPRSLLPRSRFGDRSMDHRPSKTIEDYLQVMYYMTRDGMHQNEEVFARIRRNREVRALVGLEQMAAVMAAEAGVDPRQRP